MAAEVIIGIKYGKFVLDEQKLRQILNKVPADTEIGVISIAGEFRKGKSFLLNFFLQYLEHRRNYTLNLFGGNNLSPWLKDVEKSKGFRFMAGRNRETTGIILWNEPFLIRMKNQKNLAILLIDSQGLYDQETSANDNVRLFTMVSMMSSTLMVNTPQQINSMQLSELKYFLKYAATSISTVSDVKLLQTLLFVVRDYQNEDQLGYEAGQHLIDGFFKNATIYDFKETAEALKKGFKKISAFCLPHPGKPVTKSDFNGQLNKIDQDFLVNMAQLISSVVDDLEPRNLVYNLTASDFVNHIKSIIGCFNQGLTPFEVARLQQSQGLQAITDKIDKVANNYQDRLEKILIDSASWINHATTDTEIMQMIEKHGSIVAQELVKKSVDLFPYNLVLYLGKDANDRKTSGEVLKIKLEKRFTDIKSRLFIQGTEVRKLAELKHQVDQKKQQFEEAIIREAARCEEQKTIIRQLEATVKDLQDQIVKLKAEQEEGNDYVHTGVSCDNCSKKPIIGIRYKCLTCADYDLCQICKQNAHVVHPGHKFMMMKIKS